MTNVRRSDSGQYRCLAHNSLGNATSNAATLDVQCKYIIGESLHCIYGGIEYTFSKTKKTVFPRCSKLNGLAKVGECLYG